MARITVKTRAQLGIKIQRLRKEKSLTQEDLAEEVKISRTHMGHIEQGRKSPSLELLERLSRALKVKLSDLFQR